MSIYQGWTPTQYVKPANKAQLVALRDLLLEYNDQHAAAAVDNVIDILSQPTTPAQHITPNHDLLVKSGAVNPDGSLKPYRPTGHRSTPLSVEDVTDFFGEEKEAGY